MQIMKKISILLSFFLLCHFMAWAQDFKITHGPYLYDMGTDGVTVIWTTSKPALSWVELAPGNDSSFYAHSHPRYYSTVAGRRQSTSSFHCVRLKGLQPGTRYNYRIYSREVLSWKGSGKVAYGNTVANNVFREKPYSFVTFPEKRSEETTFVMFNDLHENNDVFNRLCRHIDFARTDLVILNGDMTNYITDEEKLFTGYLDTAVDNFARHTPFLFAKGYHENRGVYADHLMQYYPNRNGQFYQLQRYGDICLLVLDCGEDKPDSDIEYSDLAQYDSYREEEARWLQDVLRSDEFLSSRVRIVISHIPFTSGDWHGNLHLRKLFLPLLNKAGIDLMLSGHTHNYSFHPQDAQCRFPTVVNDNETSLRCRVDGKGIDVEIITQDGKTLAHHYINITPKQ